MSYGSIYLLPPPPFCGSDVIIEHLWVWLLVRSRLETRQFDFLPSIVFQNFPVKSMESLCQKFLWTADKLGDDLTPGSSPTRAESI